MLEKWVHLINSYNSLSGDLPLMFGAKSRLQKKLNSPRIEIKDN